MFKKILAPVDLAHADKLENALAITGKLAKTFGAEVCFVGVGTATPNKISRTPEEFTERLSRFAAEQASNLDITATHHTIISHDPSTQMNAELEKAVVDVGADLVVMATHVPGAGDYLWSGHGAHLAAHSPASVMLVRG